MLTKVILKIYDKRIEDGGQVIGVESCLVETTDTWKIDGESALVTKCGGSTFWTDRVGHDDLQAAWENAYGGMITT